MERIYLDNAATTQPYTEVVEAMTPYLSVKFGNPSSIHSLGRINRMAVESARKSISKGLNCKPGELFFTSCGTESTNTALWAAIRDLKCSRIITSPIEHHATLHTAEFIQSLGLCRVDYVTLDNKGHIDYTSLEALLQSTTEKTLVSLMHANNEIGNLTDIKRVSQLCRKHHAFLHTDMVQTLVHYPINLQDLDVDFISGSAHKFHGPKGSGILYINHNVQIKPLIHGGSQERNMRSGTENVAGIVGFAKAFEMGLSTQKEDAAYITSLKQYMIEQIQAELPYCIFNGDISDDSLYTVLNVGFPLQERTEVLSMHLDMLGICISGGSACSSGTEKGSHVIKALHGEKPIVPIRFSFSKFSQKPEIDTCIAKIKEILQ